MRLAATALLLLALPLLPTASADTFLCQPVPSATTCLSVWTQPTLLGVGSCTYTGVVSYCGGAGHDESPGDIRNSGGIGVCTATGVCAGGEAGQFAIGSRFIVGGFVAAGSPQATVTASNYAGTENSSPWRYNFVCANTFVTGGTCLLV